MILRDTHVWIWLAGEVAEWSEPAARAIAEADVIAVSATSTWETAVLVRRGRLQLDRSVDLWVAQALALPRVIELPLTAHLALQAELLPGLPGDPADRFLAATAIHLGCPLVTKDRLLHNHSALRWIW